MTKSAVFSDSSRRDVVDALYDAFAAPTPSVIEGCPCCIETRGVDVLLTTPLRKISSNDLWRYVSGVFLTVGSERDFRYLLPRIFDLSLNDRSNINDPEIVLGKLRLAGWASWAPSERVAVIRFLDEWFECVLEEDLAEVDNGWVGTEVANVLCGIARADLPLARWLSRLSLPYAAPVLAQLQRDFQRSPTGFWEDAPSGFEEIRAFLSHDQS